MGYSVIGFWNLEFGFWCLLNLDLTLELDTCCLSTSRLLSYLVIRLLEFGFCELVLADLLPSDI